MVRKTLKKYVDYPYTETWRRIQFIYRS